MEEKEALKLVLKKIEQGQTKSSIYSELLPGMDFKEDLVSILSSVPEFVQTKRNSLKNKVLISFVFYALLMQIVGMVVFVKNSSLPQITLVAFTNIAVTLLLIASIFLIRKYQWNGYVGSAFVSIWILFSTGTSAQLSPMTLALNLPFVGICVLAFIIAKDIYPYRFKFSFDKDQYARDYLNPETLVHVVHPSTEITSAAEVTRELPRSIKVAAYYFIISSLFSLIYPLTGLGPSHAEFEAKSLAFKLGSYSREYILVVCILISGVGLLKQKGWARRLGLLLLVISTFYSSYAFAWGFEKGVPSTGILMASFAVVGLWNGIWFYLLWRGRRAFLP